MSILKKMDRLSIRLDRLNKLMLTYVMNPLATVYVIVFTLAILFNMSLIFSIEWNVFVSDTLLSASQIAKEQGLLMLAMIIASAWLLLYEIPRLGYVAFGLYLSTGLEKLEARFGGYIDY